MNVDDALIDKLSFLARLEFKGEGREAIKNDLEKMLEMVDKISEVNTDNVEPLIHITQAVNRWREDAPEAGLAKSAALGLAPLTDSDYFRAPKVLDKND